MAFTLYPALDLLGGKCVRLVQGDFRRETVVGEDPATVAERWVAEGAEWLNLVDLDAARTGEPVNLPVIAKIVAASSVPVQVGGGVRDEERLRRLLDLGVRRVVIGSAVLENPAFVEWAFSHHPDRVAIGIDARDGKVATHGWLRLTEVSPVELGQRMAELGAQTLVFTDISRDGTLSGVNVEATAELARVTGLRVIASGGVRSLEDVERLARHEGDGVSGAIIGKALYAGTIRLKEALRKVGGENR
jgi:phosphoribosylformimino-5-aminoimidazole carboxamide ribotide isomerase